MSKRTKIIIIVIAILVLLVAAYFIFRKKPAANLALDQAPLLNTGATNLPGKSVQWVPNKFPLDVNMQGDYVLALQRALNRINPVNKVPEDGLFGPTTRTKLLLTVSAAQSVLPMSGATWQQIIIDSNK